MQQRTVIKLSGSLAAKFGRTHVRHLDTGNSLEAFEALKHTIKGYEQFVRLQAKRGMRYAIFRNGQNVSQDKFELSGTKELRIVPVIEGSKRGGVFQTIAGIALVVIGTMITGLSAGWAAPVGGALVNMGYAMIIGGVVQMLSPQNLSTSDSEDSGTSYAFGGAVNTTASGNPVPMGYGYRRVGGAIISAGIDTEDQRATTTSTSYGNSSNYGSEIEP